VDTLQHGRRLKKLAFIPQASKKRRKSKVTLQESSYNVHQRGQDVVDMRNKKEKIEIHLNFELEKRRKMAFTPSRKENGPPSLRRSPWTEKKCQGKKTCAPC